MANRNEETERCRADIGGGVECVLHKNHNGLHKAKLPDGRVFEWG